MDAFNVIMPGGPMVTVHKGWDVPGNRHRTESQSPPQKPQQREEDPGRVGKGPSPQVGSHFEFVNAVRPGRNRDPAIRKLVRTHVKNDQIRNDKAAQQSSTRSSTQSPTQSSTQSSAQSSAQASPEFRHQAAKLSVPKNVGHPTALINFDFPIEMTSSIHVLLENYLTHAPKGVYPLECCLRSNPLKSPEWFQYAMGDAAMLHAILYAGALYIALLGGQTETDDTLHHFGRVVSIVNHRLNEPGREVEDSTIGAISCLALGEAIKGNKLHWETHMTGLKQIISSRRGRPVPALLMAKLRRSDITGAIDYAATPVLDFDRSTRQTTWSLLSKQMLDSVDGEMKKILTKSKVHPDLISTMTELAYFSQAIRFACKVSIFFDPTNFSEDLYFLEYNLLAFSTNSSNDEPKASINQACRLGALLYLKAVIQEFPHSTTGSTILLTQLRESLAEIPIQPTNGSLLLWLALVGGSLSKDEARSWFVDYMAQIRSVIPVMSFEDFDLDMSRILGLRKVFGKSFEGLWKETMVRSGGHQYYGIPLEQKVYSTEKFPYIKDDIHSFSL